MANANWCCPYFATHCLMGQDARVSFHQDTQNHKYPLYHTATIHYHFVDDTAKHHTMSTIAHTLGTDITSHQ